MATDEVDSFLRGVASAPALRPPPRIGERLGERYVIEAFLGEGGMGSVFRALDEKLGEQVALKIVKPGLDEGVLRDEVRLAQKVTHVNVCRTFDLEDVDGRPIVKMEYIPGETLAKGLAAGRLPIAEALRIARAIAAGLAAAHGKGIVHGDLKPGNVMIDGERVVLMDFGVAHLVASPNEGVHGTIGYLAPEKLREHSGDAGSDDYALGCVLYEMLAGETVFAGNAITVAALHVGEEPPDVRARRPEVPRWLSRAVAKLLAKDPTDRAAGMRKLVAGPRSHLWFAAPVTAALLVLLAGWRITRHDWQPNTWRPLADTDENLSKIDISPDDQWLVFESDRGPGDQVTRTSKLYLTSLTTRVTSRLEVAGFDDLGFPRFTRDGMALLFSSDGSTWRQRLTGFPPAALGPAERLFQGQAANPCGDGYVFIRLHMSGVWQLWSRDARGNERLLFDGAGQGLGEPRCDRAGQRVLFTRGLVSGSDAYIVDRASGVVEPITAGRVLTGDAEFSHDEKSVLVGRAVGETVQLFETPIGGGESHQITFGEDSSTLPALSRDGSLLAYTHDGTWFPPAELVDGTWIPFTNDKSDYLFSRSLNSDQIVTERDKGGHAQIQLLSLSTHTPTVLADGHKPFVSSDHKSIYFTNAHDSHLLDRIALDTREHTHVAWLPGEPYSGDAGPDGLHVAVDVDGKKHGYLITSGQIVDEHVGGLVTVAPSGGWRAITSYLLTANRISLVPPGAPLSQPSRSFDVQSVYNRWLDDHTLAYCTDECFELDVTNNRTKKLPGNGGFLTVETDDRHLVSFQFKPGMATMRVITNFGDR